MTVNEAKDIIQAELDEAKSALSSLAITVKDEIQETKNDTDDGTETVFLFGALAIYAEGMKDDDTLLVPLEAELDADGGVACESLNAARAEFSRKVASIKARLEGASDLSAEITLLSHEVDEELERKYEERLARLNATMKRNIIMALATAAIFAVIAVIFIIIGNL
ncbi:MAG: hypothetical protein IJX38_00100 [Clostridia bacterium]|nr:hypothetical protein [Clostridia bacterium]